MKIEGSHRLDAPRPRVWKALTDPQFLADLLPGCEKLTETAPGSFDMELRVGVAGIKGSYRGTVQLQDLRPHDSYRMVVEGKGAPGFIRGAGDIRLEEDGAGTQLHYTGELQVGGTLAAVGQRLIQSAARMILNQFFGTLEAAVTDQRKS